MVQVCRELFIYDILVSFFNLPFGYIFKSVADTEFKITNIEQFEVFILCWCLGPRNKLLWFTLNKFKL